MHKAITITQHLGAYGGFKITPQILWISCLQSSLIAPYWLKVYRLKWWNMTSKGSYKRHCAFSLLSLGSCALQEVSCHVVRTLGQPREEARRCSLFPTACEWAILEAGAPVPVKPTNDYSSPSQHLGTASLKTPSQSHLAKLPLSSWPTDIAR